ncbi:MAG TPA: hypothetical protein VGM64_07015 [Lacunisphaera sp.]|jgi:hypothetical protein
MKFAFALSSVILGLFFECPLCRAASVQSDGKIVLSPAILLPSFIRQCDYVELPFLVPTEYNSAGKVVRAKRVAVRITEKADRDAVARCFAKSRFVAMGARSIVLGDPLFVCYTNGKETLKTFDFGDRLIWSPRGRAGDVLLGNDQMRLLRDTLERIKKIRQQFVPTDGNEG